jgi:hypothetical protein
VGFINVNYLETKVLGFRNYIVNFDILARAETKLTYASQVDVENYTFFRSKSTKISRKSGGVGIYQEFYY